MTRTYLRELRELADQFGGTIAFTKRHVKIELPNGKCYFTSKTPSDWRGFKNLKSQLKRMVQRGRELCPLVPRSLRGPVAGGHSQTNGRSLCLSL